jgi:phage recombination protein Bet
MNNQLTTTNINTEMLQALRNTVAPGLTEPEFLLFAEMCRATGLNPATKEIWAIKAGGRLQLMTGINGFLKIANSHPAFDGMEVSHEWDGKQLVSCTVKVHRKDRKFPAIATAYMAEYCKPSPIWKQMPSVMLAKCAKSLAIREAFIQELGGLYTAEEMPSSFAAPVPQAPEGHEVVVSAKTGEVLGFKSESATIEGLEPIKVPEKLTTRRVPTFYDISSLEGKAKDKAAAYLRDCEAKQVYGDVYRSPIRLEKLTQCITEDVKDETKTQATVTEE